MPAVVGGLSAGAFPQSAPVDRSATGLTYQDYQINTLARGSALGRGRRAAPDPSALFSTQPGRNMSGAQFGGEPGNAKATFTQSPEEPPG